MSNILKGLLNEANPFYGHSDPDKEYGAPYQSRPIARPQEPEDVPDDMPLDEPVKKPQGEKANVEYLKTEGTAPNGERYNMVMTINGPEQAVQHEIDMFKKHEWGAKKIVDMKAMRAKTPNGPASCTLYIVDNHKYGMWTPFKGEKPVGEPLVFKENEADYGPEYQDMVKRVGDKAKEGPRKTVWDPVKRVYKTVPVGQAKTDDAFRAYLAQRRGIKQGMEEATTQLPFGSVTAPDMPAPQQQQQRYDPRWRLRPEGKEWLAMARQELEAAFEEGRLEFSEVAKALTYDQVEKFGSDNNTYTSFGSHTVTKDIGKMMGQIERNDYHNDEEDIYPSEDEMLSQILNQYKNSTPEQKEQLYDLISQQTDLSTDEAKEYIQYMIQNGKIGPEEWQQMQTIAEDWQKVNKRDKTDGMSRKAVKAYRRENPGSKLKTAVTTKPSKLKKGSKSAKRRKSFCARMKGMKKAHASAKTKRNPDSPINKALRRWNCESIEQLQELAMIAEQKIRKLREAANPAQQAAIAVNMKKAGKKPKNLKESKDMCNVCGQTPCNCTHASAILRGINNG